jgi:Domain of unknown function (DUF4091)
MKSAVVVPTSVLLIACSSSTGGSGTMPGVDGAPPSRDSSAAHGDARKQADAHTDARSHVDAAIHRDAAHPIDTSAPSDASGDGNASGPKDPLDPSYAPPLDTNPADYPSNVWVTGPLYKVQPTASPGDVHWVQISSAKNEFESFQVHVQAQGSAVALTVTMSDVTSVETGTTLSAATNVLVSREAYMDITEVSDENGMTGLVPDALIPAIDPYLHEPRNAFPFTVPAGQTQSVWVDVFVPPDTPSGYYTASVTVMNGTTVLATLPVVLSVWDFALPSTSTLRSMFGMSWNGMCVQAYGGYNQCGQYPGSNNDPDTGVESTHVANGTLMLDHRLSIDIVYAGPTDLDAGGNWTHFDTLYGPFLNGTASTILGGASLTSLRYQTPISVPVMTDWATHFEAQGWIARLLEYNCDEPPNGTCTWAESLSEAEEVNQASTAFSTLLTADYAGANANGLLQAIDILSPVVDELDPMSGTNQRSTYDTWLTESGKQIWWYQSCDEHESCENGTPGPASSTWASYMIDATPMRNRVFQWLAYMNDIQGELYYAMDYCWAASCGPNGDVTDPWVSQYYAGGNGDGTLFYPGTVAHIGGTTPVPVSSLRLEYIRDGMEDFEYLNLLAAAGDQSFALAQAQSFITNAYTFSSDPTTLTAARLALGTKLHQNAHP